MKIFYTKKVNKVIKMLILSLFVVSFLTYEKLHAGWWMCDGPFTDDWYCSSWHSTTCSGYCYWQVIPGQGGMCVEKVCTSHDVSRDEYMDCVLAPDLTCVEYWALASSKFIGGDCGFQCTGPDCVAEPCSNFYDRCSVRWCD